MKRVVHYIEIPCNVIDFGAKTSDWSKVTCGSCRLEQPLAEPEGAPEYRAPQHVLDTDMRLGLADELRRAEQDYTEAMERAALAAREANAAGAAVARIRMLLAEQAPARVVAGALSPLAAQNLLEARNGRVCSGIIAGNELHYAGLVDSQMRLTTEGKIRAGELAVERMSKPGPY